MKFTQNILLLLFCFWHSSAYAILDIHITEGVEDAIPIAVFPFEWKGSTSLPPQHFANIISSDLRRSGKFRPLTLDELPKLESLTTAALFEADWQDVKPELALLGSLIEKEDGSFDVWYQLVNIVVGQQRSTHIEQAVMVHKLFKLERKDMRYMAHRVSNDIYEEITGIRGAFTTKIAYIVINHKVQYPYQLYIADVDGFDSKLLIKQVEPLMSPSWSPDSEKIAYVSFENGRSEIYIHSVSSGQRELISSLRGINGAPNWSPQGDKLALVLSSGYNPDIHVLDLATKKSKRITRNRAIDTEPSWSPDGKSLIFTSDRGGKPQIYQVNLDDEALEAQRLTFDGDYNAGASFFPDGKSIVLVHRNRGVFHIAKLDLANDLLQVLTKTRLDESPSLAPNGSMILYATVSGSRQVLAAVSVDGRFNFTLPARTGEVRAPAWSSYLD